ncbi:hypothetical protein BG004_005709, partial [Podila humilis]
TSSSTLFQHNKDQSLRSLNAFTTSKVTLPHSVLSGISNIPTIPTGAAMTVDDNAMQKLWKLTNELTAQLVFNRNATLELKQQLADLQAKAADITIPISEEAAACYNKEHADVNLRIANERLVEENSQLQEQVKEYERWMEFIMAKFRLQNELAMRLQEENAMLQARLADVGVMARKVINDDYYNTEVIIESLEMENQGLREMLGVASDTVLPHVPRHAGNRVSFPSTGSYMASSGSDREHGMTMPFSPSEETVPEDMIPTLPSSSGALSATTALPPPSTAALAASLSSDTSEFRTMPFSVSSSSLPSPTSTASSASNTASNSTVTSPVLRAADTFDAVDLNKDSSKDLHKKSVVGGEDLPRPIKRLDSNSAEPQSRTGALRRNSGVVTSGHGTGGSRGGMTINTNVGGKKWATGSNSNINSNNSTGVGGGTGIISSSTMSTLSSAQKTKKPNRKLKS